MSSGISVSESALKAYNELSAKKADDNKERSFYVVFAVSADGKEIVTEDVLRGPSFKTSDSKAEQEYFEKTVYPSFFKLMTEKHIKSPRYAVIDVFNKEKDGDRVENRLAIVRWTPDGAQTKNKMVYTSSEGAFKAKLGADKIYQATDASDLSFAAVSAFVFKKK